MCCKRALFLFGLAFFVLCSVAQGQNVVQKYWTDNYGVSAPAPDGKFYQFSRLAKAQPDECFDPGNPDASFDAFMQNYLTNPNKDLDVSTCNKQLKTNQAYVWGLTSWGHDLWYGTVANTLCMAAGSMGAPAFSMSTVECQGIYVHASDARPPRIFLYDTKALQQIDMTQQVISKSADDMKNLLATGGLRSAGSLGDVVFLGGIGQRPKDGNVQNLNPSNWESGITLFAFNGRTRTYIGSTFNSDYTNIRQWLVTNNNLYVGVAGPSYNEIGFGSSHGYILHWIGTTADPFKFEVVGDLNADPAYLARYQDRIYVTTWGGDGNVGADSAYGTELYMSPALSKLSTKTAGKWSVVWKYSNYEVEPSAAMGGGAVEAHDGWLYWTTMVPPGMQAGYFDALYGNTAPNDYGFLGSYRPTVMFRGKFLDTTKPQIQMLYGNALLPKYVQTGSLTGCGTSTTCEWKLVPNAMGGIPGMYGHAGYNNPFNSYTWWMRQYNGELFIGTFDWTYLLTETLFDVVNNHAKLPEFDLGMPSISLHDAITIPQGVIDAARQFEGADLLRIHSSNNPAYIVSLNGVGNFSNYGIRNMMQLGSELYIGTANPFNLLNPQVNQNYQNQLGGWELLHLKPTGLWYQTYCAGFTVETMPSYCTPPVN